MAPRARGMGEPMEDKKVVLVVDDEEVLRKAIMSLFHRSGFVVVGAENGEKALEVLAGQKVDVVVSDVQMPVVGGEELIRRVKERNPAIPVIVFITAFAGLSLEDAYHMGAYAILPKPFNPKELIALVKKCTNAVWEGAPEADPNVPRRVHVHGQVTETSLGRGGFRIPLTAASEPRAATEVSFDIEVTLGGEYHRLFGQGMVRWVRKGADGVSHMGVEFLKLEPESRRVFMNWLDRNHVVPFIPRAVKVVA